MLCRPLALAAICHYLWRGCHYLTSLPFSVACPSSCSGLWWIRTSLSGGLRRIYRFLLIACKLLFISSPSEQSKKVHARIDEIDLTTVFAQPKLLLLPLSEDFLLHPQQPDVLEEPLQSLLCLLVHLCNMILGHSMNYHIQVWRR